MTAEGLDRSDQPRFGRHWMVLAGNQVSFWALAFPVPATATAQLHSDGV